MRGAIGLAVVTACLAIPEPYPDTPEGPSFEPFVWGSDALWESLEQRYAAGAETCPDAAARAEFSRHVDLGLWQEAEERFFDLAVRYARCPEQVDDLVEARRELRIAAKDAELTRDRRYRLLYGSRAAVEEVLLQVPTSRALSMGREVPSSTPSAEVEGVTIHSGDLLLSRGGAPTSAFIARGSDYPGNFSHVALVAIEDAEVSVVEAHIERGVAIATPEQYFADKKLRIMVLRMRADHPALANDPMLPHKAAMAALSEARTRHIPYDFAMDFRDPQEQFCSEVASTVYADHGVELWPGLTAFSSPGLARWMAGFGVRHLETHGPSDLEYDPSLHIVAEWHDPDTLFDDHVDNAIIDALLERAEAGFPLGHDAYMLPLARVLKGYSAVLNLFNGEGPIPEGMSATIALRAKWLAEVHARLKTKVLTKAQAFQDTNGYRPPYWELVTLARTAATDL